MWLVLARLRLIASLMASWNICYYCSDKLAQVQTRMAHHLCDIRVAC